MTKSQPATFKTGYILGISFISAFGGYLFGFDFAVISGALPFLRAEFSLNAWWEGFLTGSLALGCIVGCLWAGSLSDKHGRKPGLIISAAIFALSSLGMAFSESLTVFVIMRFAAGIGVGMASILSPMYIAEVSPAHIARDRPRPAPPSGFAANHSGNSAAPNARWRRRRICGARFPPGVDR